MEKTHTHCVLLLLDGLGAGPSSPLNAISQAHTPNLDKLWVEHPHGMIEHDPNHDIDFRYSILGAGRRLSFAEDKLAHILEKRELFNQPIFSEIIPNLKSSKPRLHLFISLEEDQILVIDAIDQICEAMSKQRIPQKNLIAHIITEGSKNDIRAIDKIVGMMLNNRIGDLGLIISAEVFNSERKGFEEELFALRESFETGTYTFLNDWSSLRKGENTLKNTLQKNRFGRTSAENYNDLRIREEDSILLIGALPHSFSALLTDPFAFDQKEFSELSVYALLPDGYVDAKNTICTNDVAEATLSDVLLTNGFDVTTIADKNRFQLIIDGLRSKLDHKAGQELWIELKEQDDDEVLVEDAFTHIEEQILKNTDHSLVIATLSLILSKVESGSLEGTIQLLETIDSKLGSLRAKIQEKRGFLIITSLIGGAEEVAQRSNIEVSDSQTPILISSLQLENRELPVADVAGLAPLILNLLGIQKPHEMMQNPYRFD